jgi:endonuclease V-like protein UPF0215 family
MVLHVNKKGIRVLGIAESFKRGEEKSVLAGVVMRSDNIIDGVAFDRIAVGYKRDDAKWMCHQLV